MCPRQYFSHGVEDNPKKQQARVRDFCAEICYMELSERAPDNSYYMSEAEFLATYSEKIAIVCQAPF